MPTKHTPWRTAFRRPWPGTVRGRALWFLSVIIGLKGLGYLTGRASATADQALNIGPITYPLWVCGAVFVAVCAFSGFCSFCHMGRDLYGYVALAVLTAIWTAAYLIPPVAALIADTLGAAFGFDPGQIAAAPFASLQGAASWALIFTFVRFLARNVTLRDLLGSLDERQ